VRSRHQAIARRAELTDPPVVRAGVCLRQFVVLDLDLPEKTDRRVEHDGVDVLGVEQLQPLLGIHAPERCFVEVGALGIELHGAQVGIAHRAERRRKAAAAQLRTLAADLELFEAVLVAHDAEGAIAVLRIDVGLPQIRRFEDVTIRVDGTVEGQPLRLVQGLPHAVILLDHGAGSRSSALPSVSSFSSIVSPAG
jgi:hypothetical protein